MVQSISPPFTPHYPWLPGEQLFANELNAAIANAGHGHGVIDYLPVGQPDGVTDNTAGLQAALDTAAGVVCSNPAIGITDADRANAPGLSSVTFPANPNAYMCAGLHVPSNSHIIVATGATVKLMAGCSAYCFGLAAGASNVLIEHYGTLDGNGSVAGFPSGGIGSFSGPPGAAPVPNTNVYVQGSNLGLITNTKNWPVNLLCINAEVNGITADCLGGGNSMEFVGITHNIAYAQVVSGVYNTGTGALTLTTTVAHGLTTGSLFTLTGAGGITAVLGHYPQFAALAGTTGNTIVCNVGAGLGTLTFTNGQVHALSGVYDPATGNTIITTLQPHGLAVGQNFVLANTWTNLTAPNFQFVGQFTVTAVTSNTISYTDPTTGKTPPTFAVGILGINTPSINVGFVDCVVRNINDLTLVFYGGVRNGYMRNCDTTQGGATGGSGSCMIFADTAQRGPNYDCEISGCAGGVYVGSNIFGMKHFNTIVRDNHIFGNLGAGVAANYADGILIEGNYIHDNIYHPGGTIPAHGDISLTADAARVKISNNTLQNPQVGCTDGNGYGIAINGAPYLEISDNRIGDYQTVKSMTAALTGTWGANGLSRGNYYGPRIASNDLFPADQSFYAAGSVQGVSYDMVTGAVSGLTAPASVQAFVAGTHPRVAIAGAVPGYGLTVGWNDDLAAGTNRPGLGEIDFYLGGGLGGAGGFNFFQVVAASIVSGTYNSTTGAVVLVINMPHTLLPGNLFQLRGVGGTAIGTGFDWNFLSDVWTAQAGTNGALVSSTGNSYNNGTGVVTLTTAAAHGITAGSSFVFIGATGTTTPTTGQPVASLNGTWTATSVTATTLTFTTLAGLGITTITGGQVSGATLAFTAPTGLDIVTIGGGNLYAGGGSNTPLGTVDITRGIAGSLLANDGQGNTRLGGALVHGALANPLNQPTLTNGGTVTIQPNTSFVAVRNSASIATGTVILPTSTGEAYPVPAVGGFNELEINFQNPIGALTVQVGGTLTLSGAPTTIAAAGTSIAFIQVGNAWLRRIMA